MEKRLTLRHFKNKTQTIVGDLIASSTVIKHLSVAKFRFAAIAHSQVTRIAIAEKPKYAAPIVEEIILQTALNARQTHPQDTLHHLHPLPTERICLIRHFNLILMSDTDFKILQANLRKSKDISQSLLKDDTLQS